MKKLTAALILIGVLGWGAQAQTAGGETLALTGVELTRGMRGTLDLSGKVNGRLPGSFAISLRYNPATGEVLGGTWKLTLARRAPGKAQRAADGALYGTIGGGTIGVNRQGRVESLKGLRMSLRRGAGRYAGTNAGGGEAEGTINHRRQHRFVGTLRLQF